MSNPNFRPWSWFTRNWNWGTSNYVEGYVPTDSQLANGYLQRIAAAVETLNEVARRIEDGVKKLDREPKPGDDLSVGYKSAVASIVFPDLDAATLGRVVEGISEMDRGIIIRLMAEDGCSGRARRVVSRLLNRDPSKYRELLRMSESDWMEERHCGLTTARELVAYFGALKAKVGSRQSETEPTGSTP